MSSILEMTSEAPAAVPMPPPAPRRRARRRTDALLPTWLRAQAINVTRHAAGLRPFTRDEFGSTAASPTHGHIQAVNGLIESLRSRLMKMTAKVTGAVKRAGGSEQLSARQLTFLVGAKDHAHNVVQAIEKVWDFYFELFGQRQTRFCDWLLSCDRVALDCYQYTYLGLGSARSVPAPPPFSYMRTGFSPATFRRSIPLSRLGLQLNPFPLIQLPYHRLMNPWTLGAILHEVSHNLQNDLELDKSVPAAVEQRLLQAGMPRMIASTWRGWNREMFADMCGLLFGGPAVIASLMDVVGRSRSNTLTFSPGAVHPTPFLRVFISLELLKRMGFTQEAEGYRRMWNRLYPSPRSGDIPKEVLDTFDEACALAVDAMCYRPFPSLGDKSLVQVIRFLPKEQAMIEEAAQRLAAGTDPGIVPERFLISAARIAFDRRLARPGVIMTNFYRELARR